MTDLYTEGSITGMDWAITPDSSTALGFVTTGITLSSSTIDSSSATNSSGTKSTINTKTTKGKYSATLVFSYVKSRLTKIQQNKLKARIASLQYLLIACDETEQHALKDELIKLIAIAVRQQECAVCGYDKIIEKKHIECFRQDAKTTIEFKKLENFPRLIPENIRRKIKSVLDKEIFDELWVLYNNPSKEQLKSTKEKIVEKDPILFGMFAYAPDAFYFIVDWVDEVCDLTLEKFVDRVKTVDPDFKIVKVRPLNQADIVKIKERATEQYERLKTTNRSNFVELAVKEDRERTKGKEGLKERIMKFLTKKV